MILGARAVAGKLTRGFLSGLSTAYCGRLGVGFGAGLCLGRDFAWGAARTRGAGAGGMTPGRIFAEIRKGLIMRNCALGKFLRCALLLAACI